MSSPGILQDIVAIFHASFHPTKGNIIDWSLKASDDLDLEGVEFSTLPSGLHLVPRDVVYFTKDNHQGVCIFQRRETTEQGHRGFRLSSLGILLAKRARSQPWRHVPALKTLINTIYESVGQKGILEPTEQDWDPAIAFFEERKVNADIGADVWSGWSHELDGPEADPTESNPTLHLSHLLRVLGPSSLTLYKHILGRRRILIYTLPPVEAACILCHVAADMCYEDQVDYQSENDAQYSNRPRGKCKDGINVLGMVTLSDINKLHHEGLSGRGWVACTTDAIFLEKPSYYDLVIDLTTSTPSTTSRPTLYVSRPLPQQPGARGPSHRLSVMRWTWSDVKLWNELDRLLLLDAGSHSTCCGAPNDTSNASAWADGWRVYEDVCIICAGLWVGSWRGNSTMSYSTGNGANWGSVRLEGDDDLSVGGSYVRNLGMGIEGRPEAGPSLTPPKPQRRTSGMSKSSGKSTGVKVNARQALSSSTISPDTQAQCVERRDRQVLTTLALLQTFHAHTCLQLSRLASFLPPDGPASSPSATMALSPKDVTSFELGPLSSFDARYLQWLADEYGGGIKVEIKRGGWRDWVHIILGI